LLEMGGKRSCSGVEYDISKPLGVFGYPLKAGHRYTTMVSGL
jgi:hypothetical protein